MDIEKQKEEQQDFVRRALTTLDILDERAEKINARLGQIEVRMMELESND